MDPETVPPETVALLLDESHEATEIGEVVLAADEIAEHGEESDE